MGKNLKDIKQCQKKIDDIYRFIETMPNLKKVILITRGPVYMYGIGYGIVDGGNKQPYSGSKFIEYFTSKNTWKQKDKFFKVIDNTFSFYGKNKNFKFYYLLENPELGFSPKNCMMRPFNVFPSECKITYVSYMVRAGEYRNRIKEISRKYPNITLLDPKDLYCDDVYCYAVKDGKMLYADDDHHSTDGSIMQAKYFMRNIF